MGSLTGMVLPLTASFSWKNQGILRTPQTRGNLFESSFQRIHPHPRVSLAPGPSRPAQPLIPPPSMQAQCVPGLVPFFHGAQAVAVHIWSLDSEALPAGPTAQAGPRCPLFAQLKLVNWNWSGLCGWLVRQALIGAARSVEHLARPGRSLGGRRPAPLPPQPLLGVGSDSIRPLWAVEPTTLCAWAACPICHPQRGFVPGPHGLPLKAV